jgi:peptide/nickel transport system substrate-binding protein
MIIRLGLRRWVVGLATALVAIAIATCGSPQLPSPPVMELTSPMGGLVYGLGGEPVSLDPGTSSDGNSMIAQQQLYNRLLEFIPGTTDPEPGLATDWQVSDDGRTWTFTLRPGVIFHDGTAFDAEAVVFNVRRWWDPDFDWGDRAAGKEYGIWADLFGGYRGDPNSLLQDVRTVDPLTVQFLLSQPFAAFPVALASGYFGMASPTAVRRHREQYGAIAAVGTGPFQLQAWHSGDRLEVEKNPTYWKAGLPLEARLALQFVEQPADRLAQLQDSRLDFTVDLTPDQLPELERDPAVDPILRPSLNVGYLALNPSYPPLSDRRVRQAIAQAINKQEIVQAFWGDLGVTDGHFTPPAMRDFQSEAVTDYVYDPAAAQTLLAIAGYPNGFDLDLWYMPVSRPYFPDPKPIAEAFAAELGRIGIQVTLRTTDWGTYLVDRNRPPGFQSFMLGWTGDYGDPDNFLYPHFGPGATQDLGGWQNQEVIQLLNAARAENDPQIRQQLYATVDELLFEEAVRIPIVHSQPLLGKRSHVVNWLPSPLGSEAFETVTKIIDQSTQ